MSYIKRTRGVIQTESLSETPLPIAGDANANKGAIRLGRDGALYASQKGVGESTYTWQRLVTNDRLQIVLGQEDAVVTLFVSPDNATIGTTYVRNGASDVQVADPGRSGVALLDNPPLTPANASTLFQAAEYANTVLSNEATVRYILADGPYWVNVVFNHNAEIIGALNEFPETNTVASWTTASTKPTTDVKTLHDANAPFRCPCFATRVLLGQNSATGWIATTNPTQLTFNNSGSIRGVGLLSVSKTLADTANFPDALYGALAGFRSSGITLGAFLDAAINALIPATHELTTIGTKEFILARGPKVEIRDTFLGAQSPGRSFQGFLDPYALVLVASDATIHVSGVYLLGNTRLASGDLPLATAKGVLFNNSLIFGTQHCQNLIGGYDSFFGVALKVTVAFPANFRNDPTINREWQANYDTNCLHILDDNGFYGLMTNRASVTSSRGATLEAIIGDFNPGVSLEVGGFSRISEEGTRPNQFAGVAGVFGNAQGQTKGPWGLSPIPGDALVLRPSAVDNAIWRAAITGAQVTSDVTLTPSPGGAQESYTLSSSNGHNIRAQAFFRGINVNTSITVGGVLYSNRFFA